MKDIKQSRRQFLRGALGAGAAGMTAFGGLGQWQNVARASAVTGADHYYVFCYFSGGWDILVGLDPKDPAVYNGGNMATTRVQPAYDLLNGTDGQLVRTPSGLSFGPFIGDLANHANKMAVIRGMSMETLTHEAGRRRFITGKAPSGLLARGSSAATHFASEFGANLPIPNLSVRVESYNVDRPNYATALSASGVPDLIRALRPSDPRLDARQDRQLDALLGQWSDCSAARQSPMLVKAEESRAKSREMAFGQLDSMFDFTANNAQMERIRGHYGIPRSVNALGNPEAQAALAAQALMGGVSRAVSIQVASGLDTHFNDWATNQGPRQRQGFNAIARLVEDLEATEYKGTGSTWLDHTVIVGFSEFSRTSMLNTRGGRDHSLTAASFALGAGIRGGVAIGRSSDRAMAPMAVDLATGQLDEAGEVPKPEHVIQTLFHNAGITDDRADLRVPPIAAMQRT